MHIKEILSCLFHLSCSPSSPSNGMTILQPDPESIHTLPPRILRLLVSLSPLLRVIRQATDILQGQSTRRQSLVCLILWNATCFWTWSFLMLGPPIFILYTLTRRRLHQQQQQGSLDDTANDIMAINMFIQRIRRDWGWVEEQYLDGMRYEIMAATIRGLVYGVPLWALWLMLVGSQGAVALMGSVVLLWPWIRLRQLLALFWAFSVALLTRWQAKSTTKQRLVWIWRQTGNERQRLLSLQSEHVGPSIRKSEAVFQFEVYENQVTPPPHPLDEPTDTFGLLGWQRWWLGANWTTNMLSRERGPWWGINVNECSLSLSYTFCLFRTDNQQVALSSKDAFGLPETTEQMQGTIIKAWNWVDNDWWVDMTGELDGRVDRSGWEYGNNAWLDFSGMPGLHTFTRRRRWCRRARLVERRQPLNVNSKH